MRLIQLLFFCFLASLFSMTVGAEEGLVKNQLGGSVTSMVTKNEHTYIAQGGTLVTVAWSDELVPQVTDRSEPMAGLISNLLVDGERLWLASASEFEMGHIFEFSLEDPEHPSFVREWHLSGGGLPNWGVMRRIDDVLYVGSNDGMLTAYGIEEEGELQPLAELSTSTGGGVEAFRGLEDWGNGLWLAITERSHRNFRMHMVDLSDPQNPNELAQFSGAQAFDYVRTGQSILLVSDMRYQLIDWSDPVNPREAFRQGYNSQPVSLVGAFLKDGYLIGHYGYRVTIRDASDIEAIEFLSALRVDDISASPIMGFVQSPDPDFFLFVTRNAELLVVDLSDPLQPRLGDLVHLPPGFEIKSVQESEDVILASTRDGIIAMSHDFLPAWKYPTYREAHSRYSDMVVDGDWLVLSNEARYSRSMTFRGFQGVEHESDFALYTDTFWKNGSLLWASDRSPGDRLKLFDISDRQNPQEILSTGVFRDIWGVRSNEEVVYVADRVKGLGIAELTPDNAFELLGYLTDCPTSAIAIRENVLAAACRDAGVRLYDLTDPRSPEVISELAFPGRATWGRNLLFDGELLWYSHYRGAELLDVSRLDSPLHLAETPRFSIYWDDFYTSTDTPRPRRTGRLTKSGSGGAWMSAGREGLVELQGVSAIDAGWTGPWHDPEQPGQGFVLEVLSDELATVTWFEYDSRGRQEWFQGVGAIEGHRIEVDEVYRTQGGAFADPAAPVEIEVIGSARLAFHDCDTGVVEMEFGSEIRMSRVEPLTQTMQIGCRLPSDSVLRPQSEQTGLWHDPDLPGQGVYLTWIATGSAVMNWFTYDSDGDHVWIQGVGEMTDGQLAFEDLYSTAASRHGIEYDPGSLRTIPWGKAVLDLGCLAGEMEWDSSRAEFGGGSMQLERLTIPSGLDCDS
jgi:hypothetical protein